MRPQAILAALAVVAAGGLAVDAVAPPSPVPPAPATAQPAPPAGYWYCPATADPDEPAVLSIAAVGEGPSVVHVERYPEGFPVSDPAVQLSPGDQLEVALPEGHAAYPVRVRWRGEPAVASWRVNGADTAAAACEPRPSPRWVLAGLDTASGSRSFLHLFNPFATDAVARVTFATPDGPVALLLTDNVLVPAGTSLRLDLNEVQPEQPDLGAFVDVLSGRLVAQGEVVFRPPSGQSGPRGRALVAAAEEPAESWAFAFARADAGASSWLSIVNPGDREAAVELRVSDPAPGGEAFGEVSVPAGGVVRVDLAEMSAEPEFGVTATTVNDVPVVVSRLTAIRTESGREGVAGALGRAPVEDWALVGGGAERRQGRVALYNPGVQPVEIRVTTAGILPPEWDAITLGPNERTAVSLADVDAERAAIGVRVTATGPIVAELRSLDNAGSLRLWSEVGIASGRWTGPLQRPGVRRHPLLGGRPFPLDPPQEFTP